MRVIMYGFGSGNNIEPWLEFFERNNTEYTLTFVCRKFQLDEKKFPHIRIFETGSLYFIGWSLMRHLKNKRYDILYIQGLYDYLIILQMFMFARIRIRVVNIWNSRNYRKASPENKKFWQIPFYRYIYSLTDRFYFTWYGTYDDFGIIFPSLKSKQFIQPWGIRNQIMSETPVVKSEIIRDYLAALGKDELFLFWPENISRDEHIDVFLHALLSLAPVNKLRVMIFCGHQKTENEYSTHLRSLIARYHLDFVDLMLGEYLPYSDIMALWDRADLSVKLSTKDQLSNGIIEALYFKTPLVLNNWMPYQMLAEKGFFVHLAEMKPEAIARQLGLVIENLKRDRNHYINQGNTNNRIIREKFNFDRNIGHLMETLKLTVHDAKDKRK